MKRWCAVAVLGLLVLGCAGRDEASGWTTLFDGSNLSNWNQVGDANWKIVDGAVQADAGKGGFLVSQHAYGDFELYAEFWVSDDANSGIFIRCSDPQKIAGATAYEVNIFDTRPDPSYGTGAIVNVAKAAKVLKAGGHWNTYEINARGSHFTVTLNGTRTVDDAQDMKHPVGNIALQYGQGVVKFRKVQIKPM